MAMFHAAIQRAQNQVAVERRASERANVHLRCVAIDAFAAEERLTVLNISTRGLLASVDGKFMIGAAINIALPNLGNMQSRIIWSGNGMIGCEFDEPIEESQFFAFLAANDSQPSTGSD